MFHQIACLSQSSTYAYRSYATQQTAGSWGFFTKSDNSVTREERVGERLYRLPYVFRKKNWADLYIFNAFTMMK